MAQNVRCKSAPREAWDKFAGKVKQNWQGFCEILRRGNLRVACSMCVMGTGQMLYRLDPIQYEAAVKSAEAKIAECKAKLEYADHNYNRNLTLYEKQATSRDLLENTKNISLNNSKFSINYNRCGKV